MLRRTLRERMKEADERDIAWVMKWRNVKKQSALLGLSEKNTRKTVSDLTALTLGRHIREDNET